MTPNQKPLTKEEAANNYYWDKENSDAHSDVHHRTIENAFIAGADWQASLPSNDKQGWIDVNDKLPDVIFTDDEGNEGCEFVIGARCNDGSIEGVVYAAGVEYLPKEKKWRLYGDYLLSRIEVTHWMPLPTPPQSPNHH